MKSKHKSFSVIAAYVSAALCVTSVAGSALAQSLDGTSGVTVTSRGVAGDMDKKGRDPQMTVTRIVGTDAVRLIVTAATPEKELAPYPIKYDFFVNRQLVSSQMTSPELPGDVSLTVTPQMAVTPFNYSIVATVLHPNRQFTSVVHGAAFSSDIVGTLSCTAVVIANATERTYRNADVIVTQSGNSQIGFSFLGAEASGADSAQVTANFTVNGETANGVAAVIVEGQTLEFAISGTSTIVDSAVQSLELTSDGFSVVCEGVTPSAS